MKLDWRNILGFAGLVTLFVWGLTLIQKVRNASPWHILPSILQGHEAQNLILLGVVIAGILLFIKRIM
jgi:hypothetical protein